MMTSLHIETPLLKHLALSAALDKQVWLKMENTQPSGSFKQRGIGLMCQRAVTNGATHLVCPSGGNAGFAAAVSGVKLGVRTTVVVPQTTHETVRHKIRDIGAEVVVHGMVWNEADEQALRLCTASGAVYVPPFDHPDIWDGHATLIDEAVMQTRAMRTSFDAVICSVGGGGLAAGVLHGLHRNGLRHVPLIAVETEGAASLHASLQAGEMTTLSQISSVATSLASKSVAREIFDLSTRQDVRSITVTDADAVDACLRFADDQRVLVEPACGAALAVAYRKLPALSPFKRPLIVVCGGIGVDLARLAAWKTQFNL